MADEFGLTFAPTMRGDRASGSGDANTPVQEAIQMLSLRLPRVVGARGAAPQPLLGGPGAAGLGPMAAQRMGGAQGPSFGIEQLLSALFGQGAAPAPSVTPGVGGSGFAGQPTPGFSFNEGAQGIPAAPAPAAPAPRPVPNKPMDESRIQSI